MPRRRSVLIVPLLILLVAGGIAATMANRMTDGVVVRTVTVGNVPFNTLIVDQQRGRAFVFNRSDGTLNILDTRTGALVRTVTLTMGDVWLAVAERLGRVFVSNFSAGTITTLDEDSGAILRTVRDGGDMGLAVYEPANRVYVGNPGGLTLLDARTGVLLGHLKACLEPFGVAVSVRTGHVFAKCDYGTTAMLDARTGRLLHITQNSDGAYGGLQVGEQTERVFEVGTQGADVLDARTGQMIRALPVIQPFDLGAIDDRRGLIYVALGGPDIPATGWPGATKSEVAVFDARTGALLRRLPVAADPITVAVDPLTGHVLVGSAGKTDRNGTPLQDGTLSVLDGPHGHLLRTLDVGIAPADIAVDTAAGRVLVVNNYGDVFLHYNLASWRPPESWWPQVLRRIKQVICCLPFQAPAPPAPTTNGTVTTLDLSRL